MDPKIHDSHVGGSEAGSPALDRRAFLRGIARQGALGAGAFAAGLGIDAAWARLVRGPRLERTEYPRFVVGGFRVHHSVVGYLAVLVGLRWHPLVLVPLGLGIIVGHGRRDRWGFLERVR